VEHILFIRNNYEIDSKLLELLKKDYKVSIVGDADDAQVIIREKYIDVFVIASDNHIEENTWKFFKELHKNRSEMTPIIFISKQEPNQILNSNLYVYNWYFMPCPIDHSLFSTLMERVMITARTLNDKSIVLMRNRIYHPFKVVDVSRINRSKPRHITLYSDNPQKGKEDEEEFFYRGPLSDFPKKYGVEMFFKQASQSWIVNVNYVKEINPTDMIITLKNGIEIPTSENYIHHFLEDEND